MRTMLPVAAVLALGLAGANGKPPTNPETSGTVQPIKADLTPQTFDKLHTLIRPHQNEWRHLQVRWLTDVVAARKKATEEDKPLLICYTGGAGYNEPLGVC
jgi:hypothetical protein